jgi:uncharacterized glyoxalase superfamily protein PhnB
MSDVTASIFPAFKYRDAGQAAEWLERAFGFARQALHEGPGGTVRHAEMRLGNGIVMFGSAAADTDNPWAEADGVYVVVDDVDAHHARALAAGAEIVRPPNDTDYGAREYTARDLEGRLWSFGTYRP